MVPMTQAVADLTLQATEFALMKRIQCGWACIRTGYACDPISACRCREDFEREVTGER